MSYQRVADLSLIYQTDRPAVQLELEEEEQPNADSFCDEELGRVVAMEDRNEFDEPWRPVSLGRQRPGPGAHL